MTHCKNLQLAIGSHDNLKSDINALELFDEITALQRQFNDQKLILEWFWNIFGKINWLNFFLTLIYR
jgi:hypothetical protein